MNFKDKLWNQYETFWEELADREIDRLKAENKRLVAENRFLTEKVIYLEQQNALQKGQTKCQ